MQFNKRLDKSQAEINDELKSKVYDFVVSVIMDSEDAACWMSQPTIAKHVGKRKDIVKRTLDELVQEGSLVRRYRKNGKRRNLKHRYSLECVDGTSILKVYSPLDGMEDWMDLGRYTSEDEKHSLIGLDIWYQMDRLDLVAAMWRSGLEVVPATAFEKKPMCSKAVYRREYKNNLNRLLEYFAKNEDCNVGMWVPDWLMVVDVDDVDRFFQFTEGEDWETLISRSGRESGGFHYWFLSHPEVRSYNHVRHGVFDIKAEGSFVILPDSMHRSGKRYSWHMLAEPIECPEKILELYKTRDAQIQQSNGGGGGGLSLGKKLPDVIDKGFRRPTLFAYGRRLKAWGWQFEEIFNEISIQNEQLCTVPLDEKEMQRLMTGIWMLGNRPDFVDYSQTVEKKTA